MAKLKSRGIFYVCLFCGALTLLFIAVIIARIHENQRLQAFQKTVTFDKSAFDFGTAFQNEKIKHQFRLLNESSNVVVIAGLRTTCSCTVTETNMVGIKVPPQGSLLIPVTYNTGDRDGEVSSAVMVLVLSKDSRYNLEASIRGNVLSDFVIDPIFIDFGIVKPGETMSRIISFRPKAVKCVSIDKPKTTNQFFTVSLKQETNFTQATVSFNAPAIPRKQTLSDLLQFPTSSERVPLAKVFVRGEVVPDIEITPDTAILTPNTDLQNIEFSLRTKQPSRLLEINVNNSKLEFFEDGNNAKAFQLEHSIKLTNAPKIGNSTHIEFELSVQNGTSNETQFVSVPIRSL